MILLNARNSARRGIAAIASLIALCGCTSSPSTATLQETPGDDPVCGLFSRISLKTLAEEDFKVSFTSENDASAEADRLANIRCRVTADGRLNLYAEITPEIDAKWAREEFERAVTEDGAQPFPEEFGSGFTNGGPSEQGESATTYVTIGQYRIELVLSLAHASRDVVNDAEKLAIQAVKALGLDDDPDSRPQVTPTTYRTTYPG